MIVPARHVIHYIYCWTTIEHLREQKTNSARNLIVNQNIMKKGFLHYIFANSHI